MLRGFDRVARVYDATRSLRPDVMAEIIDGIVKFLEGSSVIDFGVGTGRFAAPLADAGVEVAGLDVSPQMITQARDKGVNGLVLASAETVPFQANSFDYALAVHFMHLVRDWKAAVREVARVVRKGLLTVVEDPAGAHPRDVYLDLMEKRGLEMTGLKRGERDMVAKVKPAETRKLAEYKEVFDPSGLLDEYAAKLHSITWDVPDDVNARIVEEMRLVLGERRELQRNVALVAWDRDQLRDFDLSA